MKTDWRRFALLSLALGSFFSSRETYAQPGRLYAVPAGQEELVLDMLGRGTKLPDNCVLSNASIDESIIIASYACDGKAVRLRLEHPSVSKSNFQTEAFTISMAEGELAEPLLRAVRASVGAHEQQFRWKTVKPRSSGGTSGLFEWGQVGTSGLVGILASLGLVGFMTWRGKRLTKASSFPESAPESAEKGAEPSDKA